MDHSEETIGGQPIFSRDRAGSASRPVLRLVHELCPDWPAPEQRLTDDGGTVHVFNGPEGQELRIGAWDGGDTKIGLQVIPAGDYLATSAHGALIGKLGLNWLWSAEQEDERWTYRVTTTVSPEQIGGVRGTIFRDQLQHLLRWSSSLSPTQRRDDFDLGAARKKLGKLAEMLTPVVPWSGANVKGEPFRDWAAGAVQLLLSGVNLAVPAETHVEEALAAAILAEQLFNHGGQILGLVSQSSMTAGRVAQLATAAATLLVPARNLQMGSNTYQLGSEALNLLDCLTAEGTPAIFLGAMPELQRVFHGGQGTLDDPLKPAVSRPPEAPLDLVISFAVERECRKAGANGSQLQDDAEREVAEALSEHTAGFARRIVAQTATHVVLGKLGKHMAGNTDHFVSKLRGQNETLGGLSPRPRVRRSPWVHERLVARITDPGFLPYLEEHLLGQSTALQEFRDALIREVVTRPPHQPIRLSALGEPGTGKSRSAELLAQWLGIPYVKRDMTSFPSPEMAMTQLLGSAPGYVGSDQPGQLERAARHFEGAVMECSDLDHALPSVRSGVGDIFLSALETGEAQSGQGHMFSCADLIFFFTLNLPDGKDESMFQRTGFGKELTREEVRENIRRDLKHLVSGAFWSRMGDPILFTPLSGDARVEIVRRAMHDAVKTGLECLGATGARVEIGTDTAAAFLERRGTPRRGSGARELLELACTQASNAVVAFVQGGGAASDSAFELVVDADGKPSLCCKA